MTKAIALVVGLVRVDRNAPDYIKFPSGRTAGIGGCKDDADRMETLLNKKGFDINKLVTEQATSESILKNKSMINSLLIQDLFDNDP